jgi:hypothetical protein
MSRFLLVHSVQLRLRERGGETEEAVKRRKTRSNRVKRRGVIHLYTFSFFTLASSQSAAATRKKISNGRLKKLFIKRQCARRRRSRNGRSWMREIALLLHTRLWQERGCLLIIHLVRFHTQF